MTIYSHDESCCWYDAIPFLVDAGTVGVHIKCKRFYDKPFGSHDGRHHQVQAGLLEWREHFRDVAREVRRALDRARGRPRLSLGFWCSKGRHRSVGCAELWAFILWLLGEHVTMVRHVSLEAHCERRCGCSTCRFANTAEHAEVRQAAWDLVRDLL